jgi:methylated-DNA-[protein]-cysteine S-methyltransferase
VSAGTPPSLSLGHSLTADLFAASSFQSVAWQNDLGWMAMAYRGSVIHGLAFGQPSREDAENGVRRALSSRQRVQRLVLCHSSDAPPAIGDLIDRLDIFASGKCVEFDDVCVASPVSGFAGRVAAQCRAIRWGQTRTYGQLAAACGSPRAARAVGQVMANNHVPLIIPCHRVLAAGGKLGGFSAPNGLAMKRRLLAMESR